MNKKVFLNLLMTLNLLTLVYATAPASDKTKEVLLKTGEYTAKVKALVCEECSLVIQDTLKKNKAIESVSVDSKKSIIDIKIKESSEIALSELQKSLDASAKNMGMGADYTLYELNGIQKKGSDNKTR